MQVWSFWKCGTRSRVCEWRVSCWASHQILGTRTQVNRVRCCLWRTREDFSERFYGFQGLPWLPVPLDQEFTKVAWIERWLIRPFARAFAIFLLKPFVRSHSCEQSLFLSLLAPRSAFYWHRAIWINQFWSCYHSLYEAAQSITRKASCKERTTFCLICGK